MQRNLGSPATPTHDRRTTRVILIGAVVLYIILQGSLAILAPLLGQTLGWIGGALLTIGIALLIERRYFGRNLRQSLVALGYARPVRRAVVVGAAIAALVTAYLPLAAVAGADISLKSDWFWVLLGAIALNGFAEETLFRGFVFGHLRQQGRTFKNAMALSLVVFCAAHLYLFLSNDPIIAATATLVAVTTSFAYAYLFERGGNTIWALVILHTSTHAIRLVDIADAHFMPVMLGWMLLQFGAPFLVFLFRSYLKDTPRPVPAPVPARHRGETVGTGA